MLVSRTRLWLATYLIWFFGALMFYLLSNYHWNFLQTLFFIVSTGYLIGSAARPQTPCRRSCLRCASLGLPPHSFALARQRNPVAQLHRS